MKTTVAQILINEKLPPPLRDYSRVVDKKALSSLLGDVAAKYPEQYKDIVYDLKKIGDQAAFHNVSFSLSNFLTPVNKARILDKADKEAEGVNNSNLSDKEQESEIERIYGDASKQLETELYDASIRNNNPLALMVASGSRGTKGQLSQMIGAPVMVRDHKMRPIRVPLKSSYAEGVKPAEYWASSYGVRQGVISTKFATQDAGFMAKKLSLAASTLIVTIEDCGTDNGVPYSVDDKNNIDRLLARPAGNFPKDTIITPSVLSTLKEKGVGTLVIRSPITCEASKGVCSKCVGYTEKNRFAEIGDNVGINSAAALSEPLAQGGLNVRHTGGAIGSKSTSSGFKLISQLAEIPKVFREGATVAELDGKVSEIRPAPQGGTFVKIEGENHYVRPGFQVIIKEGDDVEAGDLLSEGITNPSDIVRHKGIGVGRLEFAKALQNAYTNSGMNLNRKHFELISRAQINHVRIEDDEELDEAGVLPQDIAQYEHIRSTFKPKETQLLDVSKAVGKYLAKPYLYFSLGTRVTPKAVTELKKLGVDEVETTKIPPPFSPIMLRLADVPHYIPDWQTKLYSTDLQKQLLQSLHRGNVSRIHGESFVPAVAYGSEIGKGPKGKAGY